MFMVAGIYFLRDLLLFTFTEDPARHPVARLCCRSCSPVRRLLSAFLDALTVIAVMITVGAGFYRVFHRFASGKQYDAEHDAATTRGRTSCIAPIWTQFRAFLRGLMMHAAVGTALGGVTTQVGEPQNLLIAEAGGLGFRRVLPGAWRPCRCRCSLVGLLDLHRASRSCDGSATARSCRADVRASARGLRSRADRKRSTQRESPVLIVAGYRRGRCWWLALGLHSRRSASSACW